MPDNIIGKCGFSGCRNPILEHDDHGYDPDIGWVCETCNAEMDLYEGWEEAD